MSRFQVQTMVPIGGPAIDGGDDSVAPPTDQRGITRPQGPQSDIGAVEVVPPSAAALSANVLTAGPGQQFHGLVVQVTENGRPVAGLIVTFTVEPGADGAGGKLKHTTAVTNAKGQATATLTANKIAGTFTVVAEVGGLPTVTFDLRVT